MLFNEGVLLETPLTFKSEEAEALFIRPWFRMIARVGATGNYEDFLDPDSRTPDMLQELFSPGRSGELFLYVNDGVLVLPWLHDRFYRNNDGAATVTIKRM